MGRLGRGDDYGDVVNEFIQCVRGLGGGAKLLHPSPKMKDKERKKRNGSRVLLAFSVLGFMTKI